MGYTTGGMIIAGKNKPSVEELFSKINWPNPCYLKDAHLSSVLSMQFEDIGIATKDNWMLIVNRDFPYSCSFENDHSAMDKRLQSLSLKLDIIVFHLHSVSQTICFSQFYHGKRSKVYCKSDNEIKYVEPPHLLKECRMYKSDEIFLFKNIDDLLEDSFAMITLNDDLLVEVFKKQ